MRLNFINFLLVLQVNTETLSSTGQSPIIEPSPLLKLDKSKIETNVLEPEIVDLFERLLTEQNEDRTCLNTSTSAPPPEGDENNRNQTQQQTQMCIEPDLLGDHWNLNTQEIHANNSGIVIFFTLL